MTRELIRPAEYARRRGVTKQAVSVAIRRCAIPLVEGKLDPLVADTLWKARTDEDQSRRAMARGTPPAAAEAISDGPEVDGRNINWRERRDRAEALKAERELEELNGVLIRRDENHRAAQKFAMAILAQFAPFPDNLAAEFGIDDAHRAAIRRFARDFLHRIQAEVVAAGLLQEQ
jgi:hypothetical protein